MQKLQSQTKAYDDLFSPWDDDRQIGMVAINAVLYEASKQQRKRDNSLRVRKFSKDTPIIPIEEEAKKTLLHIEQHQKSKKMQFFKNYVDRKKESKSKMEGDMPQGFSEFKLPMINKRKQTLNIKQSSKTVLQDTLNQLVDNSNQLYNQEQIIFRKYGEHKKKQKAANVERSLSLAYQPIKILSQKSDFQKKYETLESSSVREKRNSENLFGDLKLKGKKYSCDIRSDKSHRIDNMSYLPTQPKITPHYVLFGHNQDDILKKVLQQLQHKFKKIK